ncbi:FkbM family methyltransferase [Undibacterium sp. Rencai35W]|uniref:FkbM family methyltransferase n=1 Tax=Undibacterium sp. Rencai35W TaxID=3413046 RepID=UPI003BF3461B
MTFISYSQNFEDVLLWRALGHIKNGFYIDVGANDPVEHSVTKAFYDAGWSGINIEPLPKFQLAFQEQRPRDINLAIAAGATEAEITLFDVPAVNGWASNDETVASAHKADGFDVIELKVPQRTLSQICAENAATQEIHFLKIDVEGFEGEVLRGADLRKWRPWILVVEATMPNSRVTNHETWEHLIIAHDYHFAYFDGLNRYYVAIEHIELRDILSVQANVFDDFISTHLDRAWANTNAANQRVIEADRMMREALDSANKIKLQSFEALAYFVEERKALKLKEQEFQAYILEEKLAIQETVAHAKDLEHQLSVLYASRSWKLTKPLRWYIQKLTSIRASNTTAGKIENIEEYSIPREIPVTLAATTEDIPAMNTMTVSARKTLDDLHQLMSTSK